jgi:hypothetical protein
MSENTRRANKRGSRPLYKRVAIDIAGFGLMILAFLTGWLPGPGGIPLFLVGLGILSLNYEWAERLLKDFDRKRREYADKYLMAEPGTSRAIDIACVLLMTGGLYGLVSLDQIWFKGLCLGLLLLGS